MKKRPFFEKQWVFEQNHKVKCKCGAWILLVGRDRDICKGCGHWIYKNSKTKFKYEMEKLLNVKKLEEQI